MSRATGLFSVLWEADEKSQWGPDAVSVKEAIAWGRERAPVVLVKPAPSTGSGGWNPTFSAGSSTPRGESTVPWPPEGVEFRPRVAGTDPADGVQSAEWIIRVGLDVAASCDAQVVVRARAALERAEGDLSLVEFSARSGPDDSTEVSIHVKAEGRSLLDIVKGPSKRIIDELGAEFSGSLLRLEAGYEQVT